MKTSKVRFPGYRHMTGVERRNARMHEMFDRAKSEGRGLIGTIEWSGSPDPADPDNFWIDDETGERVNGKTGERSTV